mmetsp:Transcript_11516/g.28367  ORF Transcript_11516/g.28367 Transcript_11516/m.28367 type:complete len:305 (-) Transcript_11516:1189-2103(-)
MAAKTCIVALSASDPPMFRRILLNWLIIWMFLRSFDAAGLPLLTASRNAISFLPSFPSPRCCSSSCSAVSLAASPRHVGPRSFRATLAEKRIPPSKIPDPSHHASFGSVSSSVFGTQIIAAAQAFPSDVASPSTVPLRSSTFFSAASAPSLINRRRSPITPSPTAGHRWIKRSNFSWQTWSTGRSSSRLTFLRFSGRRTASVSTWNIATASRAGEPASSSQITLECRSRPSSSSFSSPPSSSSFSSPSTTFFTMRRSIHPRAGLYISPVPSFRTFDTLTRESFRARTARPSPCSSLIPMSRMAL